MKYPVFALFALCLFLTSACQGSGADKATAESNDPTNLNAQIQAEILASKAMLSKYDSTYNVVLPFVMKMKQGFAGLGDEKKAQVKKIHEGIRVFLDPYAVSTYNIGQLEELTQKLNAGTVKVEDAQKEFEMIKKELQTNGEKLVAAKVDFAGLMAEYEGMFEEANQQAAGKE